MVLDIHSFYTQWSKLRQITISVTCQENIYGKISLKKTDNIVLCYQDLKVPEAMCGSKFSNQLSHNLDLWMTVCCLVQKLRKDNLPIHPPSPQPLFFNVFLQLQQSFTPSQVPNASSTSSESLTNFL